MKFLHAADIHLDSPMAGLARIDAATAALVRDATRRAFRAMVQLAIDEDVAFVVIAGDLYDREWRDYSTGVFFAREMARLGERPVFVVLGNHDAESNITKALRFTLPSNVHLFGAHAGLTERREALGIAVHGRSFADRHVPEDMSAGYGPRVPGLLNIGVLHTSATAAGEHDVYAPCTPEALARRDYDYWALGHIHTRAVLRESPHIVFSGNLQGRHVRETGAKGCTLVRVEDGRIAGIEHRAVDVLRWAVPEIDASGLETEEALFAQARAVLGDLAAGGEGRPVFARVSIAGDTSLHPHLLAEPERIEAELQRLAPDGVTVHELRLRTTAPRTTGTALADEALGPLLAAFDEALDDPALAAELAGEIGAAVARVPAIAQEPALATPEGLRLLLAEARTLLGHRLLAR